MKNINWQQPPIDLKLLDNEVHLWCENLEVSAAQIEQLTTILSQDEKERANRFRFAEHRHRFIAARGYLRQILSRYLNLSSKEIVFNYSDRGKPEISPEISHCKLQFNVSHSQDVALYGFTNYNLIGIDIEYLRSNFECDKIAQRFFTAAESQLINSLNQEQQNKLFFHLWTAKEAYLKATGEGLVGGLETVEVEVNSDLDLIVKAISKRSASQTAEKTEEASNWFFSSFMPQNNFIATVAVNNKQQILTIKQFTLN